MSQLDEAVVRESKYIQAEERLILAALAYEEVWTRYVHRTRPEEGKKRAPIAPEVLIAKAESHQALLDAVRAYRELFHD